ncbi:hypothetical protein HPHPA4_0231 [Helicobacter pylori Hp A-4]|nr:hypothetical protein HPHPA4_0231 [Helicobacter pylori Hp A-4]
MLIDKVYQSGRWVLLLLKSLSCKERLNFLGLKFLECLYFLDIYSIIPK